MLLGGAALVLATAAGAPSYAVRLSAALDLDALWGERSPGARGRVELVKRPSAPAPAREARVAPRTRSAPVVAAAPVAPAMAALPSAAEPEAAISIDTPAIAPVLAGSPQTFAPQLAGLGPEPLATGFIGAGAGGFGFRVPPEPLAASTELEPQRLSPEAPAGVPEPATWATLILGFSLMGLRARASRTVSSTEVARSSELFCPDIQG